MHLVFKLFTLDGSTNQCQVGDGFIQWFYRMVSLVSPDVAESLVLHLMREEKNME